MQFSLNQSISQPTHLTEHFSSLIDIILLNNKENLILSGAADLLTKMLGFIVPFMAFLNSQNPSPRHLSDISGDMKMVIMSYFEERHRL